MNVWLFVMGKYRGWVLFMEFNLVNRNLWMLGDKQIDLPTSGILLFDKFSTNILFSHETKYQGI